MKKVMAIAVCGLLLIALAGCGTTDNASSTPAPSAAEAEVSEEAASVSAPEEAASEESPASEAAGSPYAVLGLQDMPQCDYLDAISSYHYIQTYDEYVMSFVAEQTEAVDGINSYKGSDDTRVYSVDGYVVSINEAAKMYMETDMGEGMVNQAKESLENAMKTGQNIKGRVFQGTGKGTIPLYSDGGDTAEYEYFEYLTDGSTDSSTILLTERFYMKDGDVFAIYSQSTLGENTMDETQMIKSISTDIPDGTFEIPDLSEYEKYE